MNSDLQAIEALYKKEIEAHKRQIEELRSENRAKNETNTNLLERLQTLNGLVEKSHAVNKDLHSAFDHVREENAKLKSLSNIDDRPPVQTNDNELALEQVQHQFISLAGESVAWLSEKDKLLQRVKFLERECERYFRDNSTLGKQVRHLLTTLEEERGMIIRHDNQVKEYNSQLTTASDVIDQHLITFESIEELQQQNQKLTSLIKDLSKEREENEMRLENEETRRLISDIEALKAQLESTKNDRERIMNAFKTILKERELFKILLCKTKQVEHMTPEIFQRMVSIACSSGPAIGLGEPEDTQDKDAHIADLKSMISKLEQEISDLRSDFEAARTRSDDELKLKSELLEQAHLKLLAESQQADILKERISLLESNTSSLMAEYDDARTRLQKTTFEMEQLKKEKQSVSDLLDQEKLKRQVEAKLTDQNRALEATVSALKDEISENRSKSQLLSLQLEHLGREKAALIDQLDQERRLRQTELSNILTEIQSRSVQQNQSKEDYDEIKSRLKEATCEVERLKQEKSAVSDLLEQEKRRLETAVLEFQRLRDIEREQKMKLEFQLRTKSQEKSGKSRVRFHHRPEEVVVSQPEEVEFPSEENVSIQPEQKAELEPVNNVEMLPEENIEIVQQEESVLIQSQEKADILQEAQADPEPQMTTEPQPQIQPQPQVVAKPSPPANSEPQAQPQANVEPSPQEVVESQPEKLGIILKRRKL